MPVEFPEDVQRLQRIAWKYGFEVSAMDAEKIWRDYSDSVSAGWLGLFDDDNENMRILKVFGLW